MPRKTKQQKIAAALRRRKKEVETKKTSPTEKSTANINVPTASTYNLENLRIKETKFSGPSVVASKTGKYSYLVNDLRKIFILSLLAIILEVAITLTTKTQFAKLLLLRFGIEI